MAFAILDTHIGCDLTSVVAGKLHKIYTLDVNHEVVNTLSFFEKIITHNEDPLQYMLYSLDAMFFIDVKWVDWSQVVVYFQDSGRIVVWHRYVEGKEHDLFLFEGFVEDNKIKMERFYFEDDYEEQEYDTLTNYNTFKGEISNCVPFQFIARSLKDENNIAVDYTYDSGKKWLDHKRVIEWFNTINWKAFKHDGKNIFVNGKY